MNYNFNMDVRYGHLEIIDVPDIIRQVTEKWWNQTLTEVNDSVVRLGIVQGEFHWHKHDHDDEARRQPCHKGPEHIFLLSCKFAPQ